MTQSTDVVLGGDGYMVVPGSYRRQTDGVSESTPGRIVLRDFIGGQRRAIQLEAERGWDSEGVGSVLFGQGIEPWPFNTSFTDGVIGAPTTGTRTVSMLLGDAIYVGIGRFLYRSVCDRHPVGPPSRRWPISATGTIITDLAMYRPSLAVRCGATRDIQFYDPVPGTLATIQTGEKGQQSSATRTGWSGRRRIAPLRRTADDDRQRDRLAAP